MSWNNALPWFIYDLEREHREAKMLCAMEEEYLSGKTRSYPEHWYILDTMRSEKDRNRIIASLGVRL